ncbi:MAG TPA: TIGR00730 family Rossman fold protein [Ignavibacteriaceae bacterium]|nr:TIGR00730 family Rossman fold protein [Ignavibacteriaceae bacterium]
MKIEKVCVYCASSKQSDKSYYEAAKRMGEVLAENSVALVYGAGGAGSMGYLADGALSKNGKVIGIIPKFMVDLEWAHNGLTEMNIVKSMHERKNLMIAGVDAAIALPGGSGTLEELMEAITWKRLGIFLKPIILVNTNNFFNPLVDLLNNCIKENFMDARHSAMWTLVNSPEDVLPAIKSAPIWSSDARNFATI